MNKIELIGNVTKDVELQEKNGVKYARFTLAVNCGLEKNGEKHVDFFNCVVFRAKAETLAKYVKRGTKLAIVARMISRTEMLKVISPTGMMQDAFVAFWTAEVEDFDFLPSAQATEKPVEPADDLPF